MSSKVPRWVQEHVDRCIDAFGLSEWRIEIHMVDTIDEDDLTTARTHLRARYLIADVLVRKDVDREYNGYETLTHECLHIAFAQHDRVVDHILSHLPKHGRKLLREMVVDTLEQDIERTARALTPLLKGVDTKK